MVITEELKREIGFAIAAYGQILYRISLGLDVPKQFQELQNCSVDELKVKMEMLKDFHSSL